MSNLCRFIATGAKTFGSSAGLPAQTSCFARTAASHLGVSEADFVAMHNAYTIAPYAGTAALLDDLRAAGMPTACLTNTNENHWRIMHAPGPVLVSCDPTLIRRYFPHLAPDTAAVSPTTW